MISRLLVISIIGIILGKTSLADGDINGKIITDFKFFPNSNVGTIDDTQSLEFNIDAYKDFGPIRGVLELIARTDAKDSGRKILEARQAYLKTDIFDSIIFLGNRQEFWGNAESKNVVDVINQRDAASGQGSAGKLGAPSLSIEKYLDIGDLQIWYIPFFREQTFNDSDAHPSGQLILKPAQYGRPDGKESDDFAARFSSVVGDWDLAGSLFYGTARAPTTTVVDSGTALQPFYPRQKSFGFEAQYTGDATLLKWESSVGQQANRDFTAIVAGLEYTLYGLLGNVWDLGVIAEEQYDDRPQAAAQKFHVGGLRLTFNDTKDSSILILASQDHANEQSSLSFEASRRLNSWSSLEIGAQFFDARNPNSVFSTLDDDDTISIRLNTFF